MAGIMQISPTIAAGAGIFDLPLVVHPIPVAGYTRRHVAYAVPQDVGATVAAWTDLAGGTPLTVNGQGGTASTAPVLASDGGVPAMEFTGTASLGTAMPLNQPHTIVVCARTVGTPSALGVLTGGTASSPGRSSQFIDPSTGPQWRSNAGASLGSTVNASAVDYQVITTVFNGASSVMRVDGVETTGTTGTDARTILTLATWSGAGANRLACRIAEILVFPFALDLTQRAAVETAVRAGRTL